MIITTMHGVWIEIEEYDSVRNKYREILLIKFMNDMIICIEVSKIQIFGRS